MIYNFHHYFRLYVEGLQSWSDWFVVRLLNSVHCLFFFLFSTHNLVLQFYQFSTRTFMYYCYNFWCVQFHSKFLNKWSRPSCIDKTWTTFEPTIIFNQEEPKPLPLTVINIAITESFPIIDQKSQCISNINIVAVTADQNLVILLRVTRCWAPLTFALCTRYWTWWFTITFLSTIKMNTNHWPVTHRFQ